MRLTLWGVTPGRVPAALARMAAGRRPLRRVPGLRFAKLLGTGDGRTFTMRDADPLHWGLLTVWENAAAARGFSGSRPDRRWDPIAGERFDADLVPLASRGSWSGRRPFGTPRPARWQGPVAAITRARLRPARMLRFWHAVPPVTADLAGRTGLRLAVGIGEAPIGLQGTFSLWESASALVDFAYTGRAHAQVVRRTPVEGWYAEELFARFGVIRATGSFAGAEVRLGPEVGPRDQPPGPPRIRP